MRTSNNFTEENEHRNTKNSRFQALKNFLNSAKLFLRRMDRRTGYIVGLVTTLIIILTFKLIFSLLPPTKMEVKNIQQEKTTKIRTGLSDETTYKYMEFDNKVRVIVASNPKYEKGAIAVSMGVGSHDNPVETAGLAHFLEHMLFMGSEKYPGENYCFSFIDTHGGYGNAYTASELTCYYTSVESSMLGELVDIISGFFISPLLKKDAVDRELNAVHSEYTMGTSSQSRREWATFREFSKNDTNFNKFSCGNLETLKKEGIHEEMKRFYDKYYSPDKCCVVISGKESVEELTKMAEVFKEVNANPNAFDNSNLKPNKNIFKEEFKNIFIKGQSLSEKDDLTIIFAINSQQKYVEENVLGFLGHILLNNEKGSLLSKLRNEKLAFNLSFDVDHNKENTIVEIQINMIDLDQKNKVIQMVYDEIVSLKVKASKEEYERIGRILKLQLDYVPNMTAIDTAEELSAGMQTKPYQYALHPEFIMEKYDKELISSTIEELLDWKNWMFFGFTQKFTEEELSKMEESKLHKDLKWVVTGEKIRLVEKIEATTVVQHDDKVISGIEMFEQKSISKPSFIWQDRPVITENNLFYVFDQKLNVPKGIVTIVLKEISPTFRIYINALVNSFAEEFATEIENNQIIISSSNYTLFTAISITGFNKNVCEYAEKFFAMEKINKNFVYTEKIKMVTELQKVVSGVPFSRTNAILFNEIYGLPTEEQQIEELKKVTDEIKVDLKTVPFDVLIAGNVKLEDAKNLKENMKKYLSAESVGKYEKKEVSKIEFLTSHKTNNVLHRCYKVPEGQEHFGRFFITVFREKFFNELRTLEQLGYVVQAFCLNDKTELLATLRVQSEKSTNFLQKRFDKFMGEVAEKLNALTENDFNEFKKGLLLQLKEEKTNLKEVSNYNLAMYANYKGDYNKAQKVILKIEGMKLEELQKIDFKEWGYYEIRSITE